MHLLLPINANHPMEYLSRNSGGFKHHCLDTVSSHASLWSGLHFWYSFIILSVHDISQCSFRSSDRPFHCRKEPDLRSSRYRLVAIRSSLYAWIRQGSSSMDFVINQPPFNGSCQINPQNGTTRTLFTVSCLHWLDDDGIEDYTLYSTLEIFSIAWRIVFSFPGWRQDRSRKMIIAFSSEPIFRVRLSVERNETSLLDLVVSIRDQFNSIRLCDLLPVRVHVDTTEMDHLINALESSKAELTLNPLLQLLSGRNQNQVGQIFTFIAQELERRNARQMSTAASG